MKYFAWYIVKRDAHVFTVVHHINTVKIFDIQCHKLGSMGGHSDIQKNFCCHETGALGGGDSVEFHTVATKGEAHAVQFFFVWVDIGHDTSINYLFIFWDFGFWHQNKYIGPVRHAYSSTLRETD